MRLFQKSDQMHITYDELRETPAELQSWMSGKGVQKRDLLEIFHLTMSAEPEEFCPGFLLGTILDEQG